jgi:hypothetical protein
MFVAYQSSTVQKKMKPCIINKMIIAPRISSPHDCHTVQHRKHLLRLHRIIISQSAPGFSKQIVAYKTIQVPRLRTGSNFLKASYRKKGSRSRISTKAAVTSTGIRREPLLRHAEIWTNQRNTQKNHTLALESGYGEEGVTLRRAAAGNGEKRPSRTKRHSAQLDHGTSFRPVERPPAPA